MNPFPFYKQADEKDCGPTCLKIISKFYGKIFSIQYLRELSETTRDGSSLLNISDAAEKLGYRSLGVKINYKTLKQDVPMPCIIHWNEFHFVVVYNIDKNDNIYISDPSYGLITYNKNEFINLWIGENANENTNEGIALILETSPLFYTNNINTESEKKNINIYFISKYLLQYKTLIIQLIIGMITGSILAIILPFLTQSIVDIGIQNQDIKFIYLIIIAQIMLFLGKIGIEIIRGWILLHLSIRVNISLLSDFFIKLMNLPISFFDTKMNGDILQRINDHQRIEQLLTSTSLNTIFSLVNIVVFGVILLYYDYMIFTIYFIGALLYVYWILFFLKKRKKLDYKKFTQTSQEQSKVIELINGMQEIKLHNAEKQKRWSWEFLQIKLFKIRTKSLSLEQWQSIGGGFINQAKEILITFICAKLVLKGDLTLGMMLSVQYIVGQLNTPLFLLIDFLRQLQDAKISLERLNEIHNKKNEKSTKYQYIDEIPKEDIIIKNLSFRYTGADNFIFENLNLSIPYQKTTAIVGVSGSGKSTLLKLLMKFYDPNDGYISIGSTSLKNISPKMWRKKCGVVMQDGYIFNDTISENISIGDEYTSKEKLKKAVEIANIKDFIEKLPLSYNTKIGNEGMGLSGGQKQRLFIARAIYKDPEYIFFDEATSSLDANNEKIIMSNLEHFFKGKTAVIIAHRLSTVKNADKIIVLDKGKVIEEGNHDYLVSLKGEYYKLIKNQLELGN